MQQCSFQVIVVDNSYKLKKMYIFLFILTIAAFSGHQAWRSIFNNFSVEVAGIDGYQMGVIQSVREIPGFLALLVIYVLFIISEHKLAALSVIIMGLGTGLTGLLPSYYGILFTTVLMSFGFHYFETLNQSLTLQYFNKQEAPIIISRLRSLASMGNIIVGIVVIGLLKFLEYSDIYIIFGVLIIAAGVYALYLNPTEKDMPIQHKKMILRKKYSLFYILTMLSGARRQVFVAFSVFLMVEKFKFSATEIASVFVLNNLLNYFINPYIGKAINKFGERKVLSLEYFSLILIFLTYAFSDNKMVIGAMYILDHIFFNFAMAIRTYFQKIADPRDIAPSMAVGFTINHIAAVIIPVIGGLLWIKDYRIPFVGAAVLAFVSLIFSQFVRVPESE